jgi:transcriptional regulator
VYIPKLYREEDTSQLVAFMREHNFATVVSSLQEEPVATHLPLAVTQRDEQIILTGHFAKTNEQWRALERGKTLCIFTGPHAYVSPKLYDKRESVPTWNYLAVHAYGEARLIDDDEALEELLAQLIGQHEPGYQKQWESLSERYRDGMRRGIVGFEMPVTRLDGKAKLSQNKNLAEQERIAVALGESQDAAAKATGEEMARRLPTKREKA